MKSLYLIQFLVFLYVSAFSYSQESFTHPDSLLHKELDLYEITIDASRNESKWKDLPVSLTMLSAKTIQNNEINTMHDIGALTPNLFMPNYGSKLTSPVYIRGVGSRINSPSVGLYVDGIPYFEKSTFAFEFFDLERIEVLRGPQGTLFGRNSMGGLIHITTKSPWNHQGNTINLSVGNYGQYRANAEHYRKLNDKFAYSLSWNTEGLGGMYINEFTGRPVDHLRSYGFRNKLMYHFNSQLSIENIASMENSKQGGYPYAIWNDSIQAANPVNYNIPSGYDRFLFTDAIKLKYQTDDYELSNTLSFQYLDDLQRIDQDFTPVQLFYVEQKQNQNMFSNELIARSRGENKLNWLAGVFAFSQQLDNVVTVDAFAQNMWYERSYGHAIYGLAAFTQVGYKLNESLSITGGLRFDYESSSMAYQQEMWSNGVALPPIDTMYPSLHDRIVLPKIALNYILAEANIFLTYTTGYKPGGFNTTFEKPEHLNFKNEQSHNYELGVKTPLFQRLVFADFAVFYTQLANQQIYLTAPSGRGSYLDNSGLSENKGVELSLRSSPVSGLEAMLAYGYTHSKILEYIKDEQTNYNHQFTPYIPRHTLAVHITQTFGLPQSDIFEYFKINTNYHRFGDTYWDLENAYKQDSYGLWNAKLSLIRENFEFNIWARNLLNTEYNAFLFEALGKAYVQVGQARQFGISLSIHF